MLGVAVMTLAGCEESTTSPQASQESVEQAQLSSSGLGSWTTRARMPTARYNLAAAVVYSTPGHPVLYAVGGFDSVNTELRRVEAYNALTNTWTRKANLPSGRANANGASAIGGKIYLSGGVNSIGAATSSLYMYDPGTNSWTTKASMPVRCASGLSGGINGRLYVLVGFCESCANRFPHRLYRYDPATNSWSRLPDSPRQHIYGAANVIDGKLYVAGGDDGTLGINSATNWVDVFDPAINSWSAARPLPEARRFGAAAVLGKQLYVIGGDHGPERLASVEAYDPATNTWAGKAPLGNARDALVARTVTYSGLSHLLALGGLWDVGQGGVTGALEQYTP
jgi:N-acetylneuraminic acid mutarotase